MTATKSKPTKLTKGKRKSSKLKKSFQRTDEDNALEARQLEREKQPDTRLFMDGEGILEFKHKEPYIGKLALMEAVGSDDMEFLIPFIEQIVNAASKGQEVQEKESNFYLSVIKGIKPQDQIEAMLGAQMAAVHVATMSAARTLNHATNSAQQDLTERAFNKLTRTFTAQMAALKKYRNGGEQKVKVEHVHVHEGGQAVVGDISHTTNQGGLGEKNG